METREELRLGRRKPIPAEVVKHLRMKGLTYCQVAAMLGIQWRNGIAALVKDLPYRRQAAKPRRLQAVPTPKPISTETLRALRRRGLQVQQLTALCGLRWTNPICNAVRGIKAPEAPKVSLKHVTRDPLFRRQVSEGMKLEDLSRFWGVRLEMKDLPPRLQAVYRRKTWERWQRYSDAELIAAVQAAAVEMGQPLSERKYAEWEKRGRGRPGRATIRARFGGWRAACAAAGVAGWERLVTEGKKARRMQAAAAMWEAPGDPDDLAKLVGLVKDHAGEL